MHFHFTYECTHHFQLSVLLVREHLVGAFVLTRTEVLQVRMMVVSDCCSRG